LLDVLVGGAVELVVLVGGGAVVFEVVLAEPDVVVFVLVVLVVFEGASACKVLPTVVL